MCRIDRQMADSQEFVFSNTCELTAEFGDDKCDFFFAISYFMIKWTSWCAKWVSFFRLCINTLIVFWNAAQPSKVNFGLGWKPLHSQVLKIQFSRTKQNSIGNAQGSGRPWFSQIYQQISEKWRENTKPNRNLLTNVPKPILRLTGDCL